MSSVVVFGPSLPGRDLLEGALARALPAETRVIVAPLRSVGERVVLACKLRAAGEATVFVAWAPTEHEAWQEVFHHYAGMPLELAERRWQAYLEDVAVRDPTEGEVWPVVMVRGAEPLDRVVDSIRRVLAEAGTPRPATACRVLLVDDDPGQLELVSDVLQLLGCETETTSSAEAALALSRAHRFDLVISDQRMAGASGTDLADALTELQPGIRVAIVTGFPSATVDAMRRGPNVDIVLAKPIGITDLVHLVEEMARPGPPG